MPFPSPSYMMIMLIACNQTGKVLPDFSTPSVYKPQKLSLVFLPLHSFRKKL